MMILVVQRGVVGRRQSKYRWIFYCIPALLLVVVLRWCIGGTTQHRHPSPTTVDGFPIVVTPISIFPYHPLTTVYHPHRYSIVNNNNDDDDSTTTATTTTTTTRNGESVAIGISPFRTEVSTLPKPSLLYRTCITLPLLCCTLSVLSSLFSWTSPAWASTTAIAATITTTTRSPPLSSTSTIMMNTLGTSNIGLAAILVLITSGFGLHFISGVPKLSRDIIKACIRSSIQLFFFGGTVLTQLLIAGQTRSWLVWSWIALTAMIAANEAYHRVEYTYPQLPYHLIAAFILGGGFVIGTTVALQILGPIRPWYTPRIWIPVAGMMLGNALTGTALAAKTVTKEFAVNADQMELRLTQGATWREAIQVPLRTIYTTSLTPLMNFLSAAGIVHVPGLMTGQILAGQSPLQAATYQMLVFMLMASTTCTAVQVLIRLAVTSLVDQRNDRLQLGTLQRVGKPIGYKRNIVLAMLSSMPQLDLRTRIWLRRILFRKGSKNRSHKMEKINGIGNDANRKQQQLPKTSYYPQMPVYSVALNRTISNSNADGSLPILSIDEMRVARTNMDVTLHVRCEDRIALTGQSGIGKSQVLRTLAGLEAVDRTSVHLRNTSAATMSMAEWRSHVVLVPQQRPSLEGTPNDFYDQVLQFSSQRRKKRDQNISYITPSEYGAKWGVATALFDRPWSKLSGGESQRIVLAIALSLQPEVLLLDESTSALDEKTEILVENTIKSLRIPVILVSHSGTQIDRFCTQRLSLERTTKSAVFPSR